VFKTVLVPIDLDLDISWRKALPTAAELVRQFEGTLHVMTVVPEIDPNLRVTDKTFKSRFADIVARNVPEDIPANTVMKHGSVHRQIRRVAEAIGADLIVMASHNPRMADYLLGSNAAQVVTHSRSSVLVVREKEEGRRR